MTKIFAIVWLTIFQLVWFNPSLLWGFLKITSIYQCNLLCLCYTHFFHIFYSGSFSNISTHNNSFTLNFVGYSCFHMRSFKLTYLRIHIHNPRVSFAHISTSSFVLVIDPWHYQYSTVTPHFKCNRGLDKT